MRGGGLYKWNGQGKSQKMENRVRGHNNLFLRKIQNQRHCQCHSDG